VRRRNITVTVLACVVIFGLVLGGILFLAGNHGQGSTAHGGSHRLSNGSLGLATSSASTATGATGSPAVSPTAVKSVTSTPAQGPTPTTPASRPTASPTTPPTSHLGGAVSNISLANNTFVVTNKSGSHTIDVNSSTQWIPDGQGGATSLATLQSGSYAQVTCTVQPNGSCLASKVSTDS
jgi:hypothetical protein